MKRLEIRKTQFTVADFLSWQREGSLDLNPRFQRRSVWKPDARSYFLDTTVRGLPSPIIYLRQRVDLKTQKTVREVVDGQQRLRTVLAFVDPHCLEDFDQAKDTILVKKIHNSEISDRPFSKLKNEYKSSILEYEFSTHVLPLDVEDRQVLEMFARLNATGVKLNHQELRNARFYGTFKTVMYRLAIEQFDRWRNWKIFTDDQISRMKEVELTSDLAMNIVKGITGKTQARLDNIYEEFDNEFENSQETERRFRHTMDEIDRIIGPVIRNTVYKSEVYFFTLFMFFYDRIYGVGSNLSEKRGRRLTLSLREKLLEIGGRFETERVPRNVIDAIQRASSDLGRRRTRFNYMKQQVS